MGSEDLYHRWGIPPRPEEIYFYVSIITDDARGMRGWELGTRDEKGEYRFPHIVISSENEKSFPFAVKPRMREQRITGNAMLHMNWKLRCFMQTDSHRKKETRSRKRSLGSARDDDTGKRTLSHSLSYRCGANLRPFGPPPSMGRRENAASQTPQEDGF